MFVRLVFMLQQRQWAAGRESKPNRWGCLFCGAERQLQGVIGLHFEKEQERILCRNLRRQRPSWKNVAARNLAGPLPRLQPELRQRRANAVTGKPPANLGD